MIVRGRYGHVSFILDPAPIRIRVVEVVPPWPPKLADQLSRVLDLAEDLPPVELVPHLVDLDALAATRPARHYLFPCRAGQPAQDQPRAAAEVSYLDEIPERAPWTLVGCARSRSIHDWFYGDDVPMVDMCPRRLAESGAAPGGSAGPAGSVPVITKCCLLEDRVAARRAWWSCPGGPAWPRSGKACGWRWGPRRRPPRPRRPRTRSRDEHQDHRFSPSTSTYGEQPKPGTCSARRAGCGAGWR